MTEWLMQYPYGYDVTYFNVHFIKLTSYRYIHFKHLAVFVLVNSIQHISPELPNRCNYITLPVSWNLCPSIHINCLNIHIAHVLQYDRINYVSECSAINDTILYFSMNWHICLIICCILPINHWFTFEIAFHQNECV